MRNTRFCPNCGAALAAEAAAGVCPRCSHGFGRDAPDTAPARAGTLPFSFSDVYGGFAEAHGLARLEESELVLEFEVKDAVLGVIKSGLKDVRIPLSDIASVRIKKGWFSSKVVVCTTSLAALADVPTADQAQVTLRVKRANKALALSFVGAVQAKLGKRE